MAYVRWSTGDWYVYQSHDKDYPGRWGLVVWHRLDAERRPPPRPLTIPEVRKMLATGDFSAIPRWEPGLREYLEEFLGECGEMT